MTVPPAEVAANRAQLAALIEANAVGQNLPAIAAAEARYSEMWARDASAMYGYAASSAAAGRLDPLRSPSCISDPAPVAQQAALGALLTSGPDAVQSLAAPAESEAGGSALLNLLTKFDEAELWWADGFDHNRATYYDYSVGQIGSGGNDDDEEIAGAAAKPAVAARSHKPRIAAGLGNAHSVGHLSVPAGWSSSLPEATAAPAVTGTYWAVPDHDDSVEAIPPGPGMAVVAGGARTPAPRYGVKPVVMPKQGIG